MNIPLLSEQFVLRLNKKIHISNRTYFCFDD